MHRNRSADPVGGGVAGADSGACIDALARAQYERLHPDDTFDDLRRRARFDKGDKGLLAHWLATTERRLPGR